MALFNKLFSSRKKNCYKQADNVCEKLFVISKDQVRVVLFRECDFRGRKLLFDSQTVQKIALTTTTGSPHVHNNASVNKLPEKYIEVSHGYGYQYIKPRSDIGHLGEMVFGAVAMSYRGTSLKIHSLKTPTRLMCSQTFPSPRQNSRGCSSTPSQSYAYNSNTSFHSLEQSVRLDDSGTSSANSISDRLSMNSTGSDTYLVCKGNQSTPLDVPVTSSSMGLGSNLTPSVIGDSGFSGEPSFSSINCRPQSLPLSYSANDEMESFSCGSLYKRWLRRASTSLECSSSSMSASASADDCIIKIHPRSSKLGLAVIIEMSSDQEQAIEQFLMEHAALIESMIWRTRHGVEMAYVRHSSFVSLMFDVATNTIQWLIDLFSGPQLATHMWISLSSICDKFNSISNNNSDNNIQHFTNSLYSNSESYYSLTSSTLEDKSVENGEQTFTNSNSNISLNNLFKSDSSLCDSSETLYKSNDFTFLNLTKYLRNEWATVSLKNSSSVSEKNNMAEKCVAELCELIESIDVKHTNFFISTLLTAVLTHHLGWVAAVFPPSSSDTEKLSKLQSTCNPLWGQLTDLYGALGHPTKVSHTIVTGTNKSELISKILNSLTYFIRCSDIERKSFSRVDIDDENKKVDCICQEKSCIPKENYKKYADHLREMDVVSNDSHLKNNDAKLTNVGPQTTEIIEMHSLNDLYKSKTLVTKNSTLNISKPRGLTKVRSCITDLSATYDKDEDNSVYAKLNQLCLEDNETFKNQSTIKVKEKNKDLHFDLKKQKNSFEKESLFKSEMSNHVLLDKVKSLGIQAVDSLPLTKENEVELTNAIINEKVRKLCRVPSSAISYHKDSQLLNFQEAPTDIFEPKKVDMERQTQSNAVFTAQMNTDKDSATETKNVIFVLGEDDKLIGLKKQKKVPNLSLENAELKSNSAKILQNTNYLKNSNENKQEQQISISTNIGSEYKPNKMENNPAIRPTSLHLLKTKSKNSFDSVENSEFKDSDFLMHLNTDHVKPSTSWTSLNLSEEIIKPILTASGNLKTNLEQIKKMESQKEFVRSQSVPPQINESDTSATTSEKKSKYRYCGVKFNFQQYPNIVTNYMRSKNLELSQLPFAEKTMKLSSFGDYPEFDFLQGSSHFEEVETLQTPSNASELEFTSDLAPDNYEIQNAKEILEKEPKSFTRLHLSNTIIKEPLNDISYSSSFKKTLTIEHPLQLNEKSNNAMFEHEENTSSGEDDSNNNETKPEINKMQIINLPMPQSVPILPELAPIKYTSSLMRGLCDHYISDMVLQGISAPKSEWESTLKRDLSLAARHSILDQPIDEAVAIVANTDTWEVQLISSHTYVVDRGSSGVRVGMSQLVANMLESLLKMWKMHTPPEYCIMHIEQKLQEFCVLSKALAELLLATEFCSIELLTSVLQLEVNDVPLLMAVASTHSPQVTQKYGLSFH